MKKALVILMGLVVVLTAWFYLAKRDIQKQRITESTSVSNISPPNALPQLTGLITATTTTNLEEWKTAIKGLKKLGGFTLDQHWLVEQPDRRTGLPITLSQNGQVVQYSAALISVNAKNETGDIIEVEMQTPNMNMDETRKLGLQLCSMLKLDPSDFLAWCDKVGNHWLDSPLFSTKGHNRFGFQTLHTYNDERPWIINFIIQ